MQSSPLVSESLWNVFNARTGNSTDRTTQNQKPARKPKNKGVRVLIEITQASDSQATAPVSPTVFFALDQRVRSEPEPTSENRHRGLVSHFAPMELVLGRTDQNGQ